MQKIKGILIPIGGNEDKGTEDSELYTLEFIDDGILFHVVKEAGGIDAKIVVIPTASSIPVEVGERNPKSNQAGVRIRLIMDVARQICTATLGLPP